MSTSVREDIDFLTGIDRFPKRTATPVKYPRYQITSDEYNTLVAAVQKLVATGAGQTITGLRLLDSIDQLPRQETTLGYIIDGNLYVYVGENGNTLSGLYQNLGPLRGEKGDKGDAFTYADFTDEQLAAFRQPAVDAAEQATRTAAEAAELAIRIATDFISQQVITVQQPIFFMTDAAFDGIPQDAMLDGVYYTYDEEDQEPVAPDATYDEASGMIALPGATYDEEKGYVKLPSATYDDESGMIKL